MPRELLKGNQAIAEAAIRAGLEAYFGYPITPQTEILEHLSKRLPELGRTFVQAESEVAAINMVYGAACTGVRVMSTSSSPGISLMLEGLSYIIGTEIPVVLVNVMRGGPGLGNIAPSQGDYNQAVHGGGHGDYNPIVLAPSTVQEAIDMTVLSFDLAERYRTACILIAVKRKDWDWATNGAIGRPRRVLSSIYIDPVDEEVTNLRMFKRWQEVQKNEVRYKEYFLEDADFVVVGFGTAGRVALSAVRTARQQGIKVGLLRPITVSPFPYDALDELSKRAQAFLVVEMNMGQMLNDVQLAVKGRIPVEFHGRPGGMVPFPDEILSEIQRIATTKLSIASDPRDAWAERMAEMLK